MTPIMSFIRRIPGAQDYFEHVNIKDYVRLIMSTPLTSDIHESIYDFDDQHLGNLEEFDLESLSFFHEMVFQMLDEHVFNSVPACVDLEEYQFKEIYFHTNALVLERQRRER